MLTDVGGVPVVQSGGGCYGGDCGMGGGGWMGMLLMIALLGGRGFGFGGHDGHDGCGNGNGCGLGCEMGSRFNQIDDQIRTNEVLTQNLIENKATNQFQQTIFKEICDVDAHLTDRLCTVDREVLENRYANQVCCCELGKEIQATTCNLSREIAESKYDNAMIAKNAEIAALKCCCETNSHLDQVERNILEKMSCNEMQNLRDRLAEVQLGLSQCKQNEAIISAVKPCPIPAYPACSPYQASFQAPFFGYGQGFGGRDNFRDDGCCGRF